MSIEYIFGKRAPATDFGHDGSDSVLTFEAKRYRKYVVSGDKDEFILGSRNCSTVRPKKHRHWSTERREVVEKIFVRGDEHNVEGDVGGYITREKTLRNKITTITEPTKTRRPDWLNIDSTVTTRQKTHLHKGQRMTIRGIHLRGV